MNLKSVSKWAAAPVGLAVSAVVVLGYSSAAFSDTQTNTGSTFATHDNVALALKDGANSTTATLPLFDTSAAHLNSKAADGTLLPNQVVTNDITVNYTGKNNANIKLAATGATAGTLADDLLVSVYKADGTTLLGTADQKLSVLSVPTVWDVAGAPTVQQQKFVIKVKLAGNTAKYDQTLNGVGFAFTADAK
jgi:hypothetical protein